MLIDTDVLIWMTRGHAGAAARLQTMTPWRISERAMQLIDAYALSHGVQLGDALIAATALKHGLTVFTANAKHFCAIDGLHIEVFVP